MEEKKFWEIPVLRWRNLSLWKKLYALFFLSTGIVLGVNLYIWSNADKLVRRVDSVYGSNTGLNDLQEKLDAVQFQMIEYLNTKSSQSMEDYFSTAQDFSDVLEELSDVTCNNKSLMMEKNIKRIAEEYLFVADETVESKRTRNVERYKAKYEEANQLYAYVRSYLYSLNNEQFKNNSKQYNVLKNTLSYSEQMNIIIFICLILLEGVIVFISMRRITSPLVSLSKAANEVSNGNFEVQLPEVQADDEVGTVVNAFRRMIVSIKGYIQELTESARIQAQLREKEHEMENYLMDAKLNYLQAQIHPHFLFNCLNAGAQLAMLEDAPRTYDYIQNMANFFRYNLKNKSGEVTLREELKLIDHYIYILNVRFAGEIHYEKNIDEALIDIRMPSMVLQPIVENSVNYGVNDISWEKKIEVEVSDMDDVVCVCIRDNGVGIPQDKIEQIMSGQSTKSDASSSNGVGMANVISRLKLYYHTEEVIYINSEGENMGTEVMLYLPRKKANEEDI
ncbi:MAG: histidine kinase [Lachnospiraceae bacterium]|nr:histidine kinase [Lachnospiraceae bacterium]